MKNILGAKIAKIIGGNDQRKKMLGAIIAKIIGGNGLRKKNVGGRYWGVQTYIIYSIFGANVQVHHKYIFFFSISFNITYSVRVQGRTQ